ncbi:MAG: thermonuclease family protein [Burkholderiaceae bacterium]|nr:thermonuclease family protein [Burkholderiaceae bacterium]
MHCTRILALAAAFCLALGLPLAGSAATLSGHVDKVIDGDSLVFAPAGGGKPLEVRLHGIDAPEGCQAGGEASREYLASFVMGKPATLQTKGKDSYGRTLGVLTVEDLVVNQRMVAEGHAWSLRSKWNQGPYVAQEKVAQAFKRGLHAERGAVFPWDFRRSHGPCGASDGAASAPKAAAAEPAASRLAVPAATVVASSGFRCDGRTHCSQMRSCAEAEYFLAHCPGVKMDGNRDGVPCEQQWCVPRR